MTRTCLARRSHSAMRRRRTVAGLSLVELMVSMALGLVVVAAVLFTYAGSLTTSRQVQALSRMTQDAQLALAMIGRDLEMAGYAEVDMITAGIGSTPATLHRVAAFRPVFGCDAGFVDPAADFNAATCATGGTPALEVNTIATHLTTPLNSLGKPTDCLGRGVPSHRQISHRYYVAAYGTGAGARNTLYCASNAAKDGQPLVEGVESLRLRYGIASQWDASDPAKRRPDAYLPAALVPSWDQVVAVRVCVLMRSAEPVLSDEVSAQYLDCDGNTASAAERRLYRAFHGTFTIREKAAW